MPVKISPLSLIPVLAIAAACGGSASDETQPVPAAAGTTTPAPLVPSNAKIAQLIYDSSYTVPDGFFVDGSYTVHHVLDESFSYELCTDDYATALAWEEADNASRNVQGYYVESFENERYFEFARELSYTDDVGNISDVTSPGFARVFKCSNINRDGVDRNLLTGYAGTLNAHPLDAESVRVFAEYLWQFTFFPVSRKKVIESYSIQTGEVLRQTLVLAFATTQGVDRCDRIEIAEWSFGADRASGEIDKTFTSLRAFEAKLENGAVVVCD